MLMYTYNFSRKSLHSGLNSIWLSINVYFIFFIYFPFHEKTTSVIIPAAVLEKIGSQ